jgi:hypothetical protein
MTSARKKIEGTIVKINQLKEEQIVSMWSVFAKYYDSIDEQAFRKDLAAKTYIILIVEKSSKTIKGFSTVQIMDHLINRKKCQIIYSGDTVIEKEYWGTKDLQTTFSKLLFLTKLKKPLTPTYWFLISKGYKTYLLLAKNIKVHWPNVEKETPTYENQLLNDLCKNKFTDSWRPELGVLKFKNCLGKLKGEVAPVTDLELKEPLINFFVSKNPGHIDGDELCCLGNINLETITHLVKKNILRILNHYLSNKPQRSSASSVTKASRNLNISDAVNKSSRYSITRI